MDFQLKDGPLKQPYRQRPQLGSSISAYDIEGATGTLGGYLKLIMPNNTTKFCALTCHHVLRPPTGSSSKVVPPEYRSESEVLCMGLISPADFVSTIQLCFWTHY